ncbi:hypothetical protein K1720_09200 [Thermococcus argininiproducens]|uniref:Uncharacterized protein n=1 Tax=Thermococcus argininiproducens TaxID=2866384 RepID=A0A9E7SC72_9EURY|nr:hypothetical protein [Thermococcus argininiproducens]USG99663.1 hypothetical protein K1720_09200 [Thermococcus argininiproducens]
MNEFIQVIILLQIVFLIGLIYTLRIEFILNEYDKKVKRFAILQISGGLMLIVGISGYVLTTYLNLFSINSLIFVFLTYLGAVATVMPYNSSSLLAIDKEFAVQLIVMVIFIIYSFIAHMPYADILLGAIGIVIISLIRSLLLIHILSIFLRTLLRLASWLVIIQTWINPFIPETPITCKQFLALFVYFVSLLIWQYSTVRIYNCIRGWM